MDSDTRPMQWWQQRTTGVQRGQGSNKGYCKFLLHVSFFFGLLTIFLAILHHLLPFPFYCHHHFDKRLLLCHVTQQAQITKPSFVPKVFLTLTPHYVTQELYHRKPLTSAMCMLPLNISPVKYFLYIIHSICFFYFTQLI